MPYRHRHSLQNKIEHCAIFEKMSLGAECKLCTEHLFMVLHENKLGDSQRINPRDAVDES